MILAPLALLLVRGIFRSASEEVVGVTLQVIKSPLHHTFRDGVGPRILLLPALIELLFQRKSVRRFQLALLLGNGFLLFFVRLILLLPLLAPPVVDKTPGPTSSFEYSTCSGVGCIRILCAVFILERFL